MKKIIIILTFSILASSNLFAENFKINNFNFWLYENGYHQYLNIKENPVCKEEPKYSSHWYGNNCDKFQGTNNLDIKIVRSLKFITFIIIPKITIFWFFFTYWVFFNV